MDAVNLVRRLHQHRAWVNQNLLRTTAELPEQKLHAQFPIGQGSIWKSLLHLYAAEYGWLAAMEGDDHAVVPGDVPGKIPGNQLGEGGITGFDDLKQKWSALDQRWDAYLTKLNPTALDETISKVSASAGGQRFYARRSDALLHVCTHAQYTAAQVVNMFRQNGVEKMPDVMLMALARQENG